MSGAHRKQCSDPFCRGCWIEEPKHTEDPLDSLRQCVALHVRDWSVDRRDAWLYGIICGWDYGDSLVQVARDHAWSNEAVERLKRLRARFMAFGKVMSAAIAFVDAVEKAGLKRRDGVGDIKLIVSAQQWDELLSAVQEAKKT